MYWPGGVRRRGGVNVVCGFRRERGKASVDTRPGRRSGWRKRERAERQKPEALSTDATLAGGLSCSSDEAPVMGVERRGRLIREGL